ncbi:MAG: hypothetical protein U0M12_01615 [Acutalibacteraceae bacterium]|nr:hypothetical protein [Acutalibacteraceae bacterium]
MTRTPEELVLLRGFIRPKLEQLSYFVTIISYAEMKINILKENKIYI